MAHEQIIRNGLIVDKKFSFLSDPTIYVSGITQTGPLVDRYHIVTETAIKYTIEHITLDSLSGVNFGTANNDDILVYNGTEWVATGLTSISGDFYSKTESDTRFVNATGDSMTGNLTMNGGNIVMSGTETVDGVDISVFKSDYDTFVGTTYANRTLGGISDVTITSVQTDDFIRWNGTNWVNVATTTVLNNYYTKSEANTNFVDATGDSMTGNLTMNGGNIVMSGTETVDGVDISQFKSDYDNRSLSGNTDVTLTTPSNTQLLQYNGTNWVNVDASSVVTNSYTKAESDDKFVFVSGDTMTGELTISVGAGNRALSTTGDVYITGDLTVSGTTTTIDSINTTLKDNLLLLNSGETGAGVSNGTAGFLVDRGTLSAVTLIYDEATFTIRAGETSSTITDNTIDLSHTVALATILDYNQMYDNSFTFYKKHSATNGILMNLSGFTIDTNGDLKLTDINLVMNGTETVDGVDISQFKSNYDTFVGTTYPNRTLGGISDVDTTGASNDDILAYNSTSGHWELTTVGSLAGDFYSKSESDNRFVNITGDTMTGTLNVPTLNATSTLTLNSYSVTDILDEDTMASDSATALATQQSIKAYVDTEIGNIDLDKALNDLTDVTITSVQTDDFIRWNGTAWVNVATTTILNNYYTKSEADTRYVNVTGDTMTGNLTMNGGNIVMSGTETVDGVDISQFKSDYDTFVGTTYPNRTIGQISDVTITSASDSDVLVYSGTTWVNKSLTSLVDNKYVDVAGDTMTGDLTITPLSGTGERLVTVDAAGKLTESNEYIYKVNQGSIGTGDTTVDSIDRLLSKGAVWEYVIYSGSTLRAGIITAVWSGTNVDWNETTTPDIGGSTLDVEFKLEISGSNVILETDIVSGTWAIDLNRHMIG
jgi:SOS-response transcriptional repressor LexA